MRWTSSQGVRYQNLGPTDGPSSHSRSKPLTAHQLLGSLTSVRNVFDQYRQWENRLTHVPVTALVEDARLLRSLLADAVRSPAPTGAKVRVIELSYSGARSSRMTTRTQRCPMAGSMTKRRGHCSSRARSGLSSRRSSELASRRPTAGDGKPECRSALRPAFRLRPRPNSRPQRGASKNSRRRLRSITVRSSCYGRRPAKKGRTRRPQLAILPLNLHAGGANGCGRFSRLTPTCRCTILWATCAEIP